MDVIVIRDPTICYHINTYFIFESFPLESGLGQCVGCALVNFLMSLLAWFLPASAVSALALSLGSLRNLVKHEKSPSVASLCIRKINVG